MIFRTPFHRICGGLPAAIRQHRSYVVPNTPLVQWAEISPIGVLTYLSWPIRVHLNQIAYAAVRLCDFPLWQFVLFVPLVCQLVSSRQVSWVHIPCAATPTVGPRHSHVSRTTRNMRG